MAASKWQVYHEAKQRLLSGDIDFNAATLRMKIVKGTGSATVSNYALSTFASAGTAVAFSGAVTTKTPPSISVRISGTSVTVFDFSQVVFTASGALTSLRYAVIGLSGSYAIAWSKLSADTSLGAGSTLTITPPAAGVITLSGGTTA